MNETQARRRGHRFLPPKAVLSKIPALYATDSVPVEDKTIWVHYFSAGQDWWIAELDPDDGLAFGYSRQAGHPDGAEWGYVSLAELEQVNAHRGLVIVERDCWWKPRKFSEISELAPDHPVTGRMTAAERAAPRELGCTTVAGPLCPAWTPDDDDGWCRHDSCQAIAHEDCLTSVPRAGLEMHQ